VAPNGVAASAPALAPTAVPVPVMAAAPIGSGVVSSAMSSGQSGLHRLPGARLPQGHALSELLAEGPARDRVLAAEAEFARGDYAAAVRITARAFSEASRAESASGEIAPVLHALVLGLDGQRYLRFCEVAQRAERGTVSSRDALFAIFFLVDSALGPQ
jgi:hypothetical protein